MQASVKLVPGSDRVSKTYAISIAIVLVGFVSTGILAYCLANGVEMLGLRPYYFHSMGVSFVVAVVALMVAAASTPVPRVDYGTIVLQGHEVRLENLTDDDLDAFIAQGVKIKQMRKGRE